MLLSVLAALATLNFAESTQCDPSSYHQPAAAHSAVELPLLAGHTRSVVEPFQFAVVAPESRMYTPSLPGWHGTISAAAIVTPALGARFAMYLVNASAGASSTDGTLYEGAPSGLERFLYVLHGTVFVKEESQGERRLEYGGFVYYAPGEKMNTFVGDEGSSFVLIDQVYAGAFKPVSVIGNEAEAGTEFVPGEVFKLRRLLNGSDPGYDFNIHIMDFAPGEYMNVKEVHYNQHGLLMLRGHGIYLLGERFFPVATGDALYMAPFVPQWFGALGPTSARYFLYKDVNTNPLLH
ncbi:unnamed protein product [Chondrus crispus]|uniref:Cupin 2 conserved barrel domain-containing protein n=1 Tax=Chondrus crispus TaxID=2769 RepID=R7QHI7_CHOCR|nr:unnamed protein product [Chondrus crispus]CDF36931.1 unnamed protein product [Chondrus crispus]|eukprot:XP_005716750.1 unnamed protein product [Chondrus crispus]